MQGNASKAYLARIKKSFRRDYDGELPAPLVVPSSDATWLEPDRIPNPARIGPLLSLPTKSFEISMQQIPGHGATDLQRYAHEAVHYVRSGHGYSEIGGTRHDWRSGDFIYTPPWTIHRHYNFNAEPAELIIIENSKLLEALGLHERESFGLMAYADYLRTQRTRENATLHRAGPNMRLTDAYAVELRMRPRLRSSSAIQTSVEERI